MSINSKNSHNFATFKSAKNRSEYIPQPTMKKLLFGLLFFPRCATAATPQNFAKHVSPSGAATAATTPGFNHFDLLIMQIRSERFRGELHYNVIKPHVCNPGRP
jgi:hypothetical protein